MKNRIIKILREGKDDFDWATSQEPTPRVEIDSALSDVKYTGNYEIDISGLVDVIQQIGLTIGDVEKLNNKLSGIFFQVHGDASSDGYDEGHNNGYQEGYEEGHEEGYDKAEEGNRVKQDEAYESGEFDGQQKGYEKGYKKGHMIGHEEGMIYERGEESKKYEEDEGNPYDPKDYDGGY